MTATAHARAGSQSHAITGVIQSIVFRNDENGFTIIRVKSENEIHSVVCHAVADLRPGTTVTATGNWRQTQKFGPQFQATMLEIRPPVTTEGITEYLSSDRFPGIGKGLASRIANHFGPDVFTIIESEPERLKEIPRLGKKADVLIEKIRENRNVQDVMLFLNSHGISTAYTKRIFERYGTATIETLKQNPYILCHDIRGIGFRKADEIARHFGIRNDDPHRLNAGLEYVLEQIISGGHCGYPENEFIAKCVEILEISERQALETLEQQVAVPYKPKLVRHLISSHACIMKPALADAETNIAANIKRLARFPVPWFITRIDAAIDWAQNHAGFQFADRQKDAIRQALTTKVSILTGGPGTGKTTIINAILAILAAKGHTVTLCAPSGLAAKRMQDATGLEARTIHATLGLGRRDENGDRDENLIETSFLVVDESSMIDVPLMNNLLQRISDHCAVLFVGDIDQIPPVGPGQPFKDMMTASTVPVVRLNAIHRQGKGSRIIENAHRINNGDMPDLSRGGPGSDFHFIESESPEDATAKLIALLTRHIPHSYGFDPVREVQVLSPMKNGTIGVNALNQLIQKTINANPAKKMSFANRTFAEGDKVMQTTNNNELGICNGDIGIVNSIDTEKKTMTVNFQGNHVTFSQDDDLSLVHAYATTIHKSQGSEYPCVIILLTTQHFMMLQRNLLFTAITRSRKLTVFIGQKKAIAMAVANNASSRRWTRLAEILQRT